MNENIYQDIYQELSRILPKKWKKLIFYIEYTDNSYSMKYYIKEGFHEYVDCYKLNKSNLTPMISVFNDIHNIVYSERKKLSQKDTWTVLTLIIDSSGAFNAYYDYSDHHQNIISWEEDWKKKYLK